MLFSRSKSRHRKAGNLKSLISNPIPIDPIRINGAFIDLRAEPQSGSFPKGNDVHVRPVIEIPPENRRPSEGSKSQRSGHGGSRGSPALLEPPGFEFFTFDDFELSQKQETRTPLDARLPFSPYHPQRPGTASSNNSKNNYPHSYDLPSPSTAASSPQILQTSVITNSPLTYYNTDYLSTKPTNNPHIPTVTVTSIDSGRPRDRERVSLSPTEVFYQSGQQTLKPTSISKKRSSSIYSTDTTNSVSPDQQKHRPDKLDLEPAQHLQRSEAFNQFELNCVLPDPVSPLLPSPRGLDVNDSEWREKKTGSDHGISPYRSPKNNQNHASNHSQLDNSVDFSFGEFDVGICTPNPPEPQSNSQAEDMKISLPKPPGVEELPSYLGRLENVQRGPGDLGSPGEGVPKRSLSRKVSTKLRGIVSGNGSKSQNRSASPNSPANKVATLDPLPFPESEKPLIDSKLEEMIVQFDSEHALSLKAPKILDVKHKAGWSYNHSASSSADSLEQSRTSSDVPPGLTSHRSSTRSSDRNPVPDSPVTPDDDTCAFGALRGSQDNLRDTVKSDVTVTQRDYAPLPPLPRQRKNSQVTTPVSVDPPERHTIPRFTHEPPTPDAGKYDYERKCSIVPEPDHFFRATGSINGHEQLKMKAVRVLDSKEADNCHEGSAAEKSPNVSASISPTTASNPVLGGLQRSPTGRKPPFGPGGPKMLLRSATMSSRPASKPIKPVTPTEDAISAQNVESDSLQPRNSGRSPSLRSPNSLKSPNFDQEVRRPSLKQSISEQGGRRPSLKMNTLEGTRRPSLNTSPLEGTRRPSLKMATSDMGLNTMKASPLGFYCDSGDMLSPSSPFTSFSFAPTHMQQDDNRVTRPNDSFSQAASPRTMDESPHSPTPFDQDRSLPRQSSLRQAKSFTNLRRPSASRGAQNDRVTALLRGAQSDLSRRPSTAGSSHGGLRLDTNVTIYNGGASLSAVEPQPRSAVEPSTIRAPPTISRSKSSVSEGLRRAFSRRRPAPGPAPSPTPSPEMSIAEEEEGAAAGPPQSEVSGPLGNGTGSEISMARWNTAIRAASISNAVGRSSSVVKSPRPLSTILKAQPLTAEDRQRIQHVPGTLFIRTCEFPDADETDDENGPVGETKEHRLKPRKGGAGKCAFCNKGPFANMWVCLDDGCTLVVCRMCCNEKAQAGEAEIF